MVIFIVSHRSGCLREETSPFQNEYVARWKRTWSVRTLLRELGPTDLQLKARHFQPDGACRRIQARICSSHCQNHRRQDQKGMRELAKKPYFRAYILRGNKRAWANLFQNNIGHLFLSLPPPILAWPFKSESFALQIFCFRSDLLLLWIQLLINMLQTNLSMYTCL